MSSLTFSLFSSFTSFLSPKEVSILEIYNRVRVDSHVVRKKICKGGFKSMLKSHEYGKEETTFHEDMSAATFVEFKLMPENIVIGFYSNGKIRMAGKMNEHMDVHKVGMLTLRDSLKVYQEVHPFCVNNITGMFRMPYAVSCDDVAKMFEEDIHDIIYPGGEVPPYTVVRLLWKGHANVIVNYTPNTGAFQVLGCQSVQDVRRIYDRVCDLFQQSPYTKQELNVESYKNKFELVGMKKEGRGRPTKAFMEEYNRRLALLHADAGFLNANGEWSTR